MPWAKSKGICKLFLHVAVGLTVYVSSFAQDQFPSIPTSELKIITAPATYLGIPNGKPDGRTNVLLVRKSDPNQIVQTWSFPGERDYKPAIKAKVDEINKYLKSYQRVVYQTRFLGGVSIEFVDPTPQVTARPQITPPPRIPNRVRTVRAPPTPTRKDLPYLPNAARLTSKNRNVAPFEWKTIHKVAKAGECTELLTKLANKEKVLIQEGSELQHYLKLSGSSFQSANEKFARFILLRARKTAYEAEGNGMNNLFQENEPNLALKKLLGATEYQFQYMNTIIRSQREKNSRRFANHEFPTQTDRNVQVSLMWDDLHIFRRFVHGAREDLAKACKNPEAAIAKNQAVENTIYGEDSR